MGRKNIDIICTNKEYDFASLVSGVSISHSALKRLYISKKIKKIKYSSIDNSTTVFLKNIIK